MVLTGFGVDMGGSIALPMITGRDRVRKGELT
jgi:hypothetical protein